MARRAMEAGIGSSVPSQTEKVGNMSEFTDRARRALGSAQDFAGEFAEGAARGGRKAAKFVVREVREHPLRTLAIGAAIGAVVAAVIMLRNRSEDE